MNVCGLSDASDVEGCRKRYAAPPSADVPRTIKPPARGRRSQDILLAIRSIATSIEGGRTLWYSIYDALKKNVPPCHDGGLCAGLSFFYTCVRTGPGPNHVPSINLSFILYQRTAPIINWYTKLSGRIRRNERSNTDSMMMTQMKY